MHRLGGGTIFLSTPLHSSGEFLYRLSKLNPRQPMRFLRQNRFRILLCLIVQAAVGVSMGAVQGSSETRQHSSAIEHLGQAPNLLRLNRGPQCGPSRLNDRPTPSLPPQAVPVFHTLRFSEAVFGLAARPLSREGHRLSGRSPPTLL